MPRVAIVIGATGLVGRLLLKELSASQRYAQIIAVARRYDLPNLPNIEPLMVSDFAQLPTLLAKLPLQDADAFSCLGTTLRQAGSKARFKEIDYHYNLAFAQACKQAGVRHFFLLSATGAAANSAVFYNQVKGELERDVTALGFPYLSIFQPSLLIGEHADPRPAEAIGQRLFGVAKALIPSTFAYRPIEAARVACAMRQVAIETADGGAVLAKPVTLYSNANMLKRTLEIDLWA